MSYEVLSGMFDLKETYIIIWLYYEDKFNMLCLFVALVGAAILCCLL
jgi:uncharacterized membrane protein YeaQ/YmgE (transglycosylase-associated protein family)